MFMQNKSEQREYKWPLFATLPSSHGKIAIEGTFLSTALYAR
jgi:hypothetical protein